MNKKNKAKFLLLNFIPIILMIGLIPIIKNDLLLTWIYLFIIFISFFIKYNKKEYIFFIFWFFIMIISESLFISTWVETFNRNSLFWLMPLWLPFLWAYSFVAMKRAINIIEK